MTQSTSWLADTLRLHVAALMAAALLGAQPPQTHAQHENLNALLWIQTSAEYAAAASQTYHMARRSLARALQDKNWTAALEQKGGYKKLPPAVVLDLDETVLDNSSFVVRRMEEFRLYSENSWSKWMAELSAGLVPGSREFLEHAVERGVTPIFITNRTCQPTDGDDPTVVQLRKLGIPLSHPQSQLRCRAPSTPSDKGPRRAEIARTHRILLLIGDDFHDFVSVPKDQATPEGRMSLYAKYARNFGDRWFMVPNPLYGSWEAAAGSSLENKLEHLRP